jgi:hypothetical protein
MRLSAVTGVVLGLVFAGRTDGGLVPAALAAIALFVPLAFAAAPTVVRVVLARVHHPVVAP